MGGLTHNARIQRRMSLWLLRISRQIKQVNAHKNGQEPTQERDCVGPVGRVEPLEEDGRGDDGGCSEEDEIYWVDDVS